MEGIADKPLRGATILVVEDDALLAFDIITSLRIAGAHVVGPAMSLERALELAKTPDLSCAILDIRLRDGQVFPAAELLRLRGVGIVFYTGHGEPVSIKRDWPDAEVLLKPATLEQLMQSIIRASRSRQKA